MDPNLKKPAVPAGWQPLHQVAKLKSICPGHLARLCRDVYAAQELARKCLHCGKETWCLAPEAVAQLTARDRATPAPSDTLASTRSTLTPADVDAPLPRQSEASSGSDRPQLEGAST